MWDVMGLKICAHGSKCFKWHLIMEKQKAIPPPQVEVGILVPCRPCISRAHVPFT